MRIVIATVQVPFVWGGAEYLAKGLKEALERAGHEAEIVTVPFKWYPPERIPEHILACRLFDLTESCGNKIDLLIGLKFPAYYFRHPNKVLWILHQYRQAYELWGTEYSDLHLSPAGPAVRGAIMRADNLYLNEARRIFTIAQNVSSRLRSFNQIPSTPLYHPCPGSDKFYCEAYDNYVLFPSRLNDMKRQHLAVEAMRHVRTPVKLYLVGRADMPAYRERLEKLVRQYGLEERVRFFDFISEEEKRTLYARCRAVLFPPYDEDYGYVTLEAFYSSKAVITCADSGGPLEFVENGENGFICEPDPLKIAEAIDALGDSESLARRMGENAREKILDMGISWELVVRELTSV
ncbi:D-inositol 3-phosphate glycosyltransferase [Moorella thermoacetica]|uniref:D-inositol 3-phosphate glycosyltransferase n=1 Tax=Neomoorella thermoacetica TaxID=1525 RepID=A0A1J5JTQ6_NEOTH|nr:glycosyltransferase family 4 protein [Moorella thermoacetica]OIQ07951.1 D-inositol 3-phosphate glycosyltransferase [Moorella thermoacetica]